MGADGGVCWIKTSNPDRLESLLKPFNMMYFEDYYEQNNEWMQQHSQCGYIYATYGTTQNVSMENLPDFLFAIEYIHGLHEAERYLWNPWGHRWMNEHDPWGWFDYTFNDVAQDLKTIPLNMPWPYRYISDVFRESFYSEEIFSMKIIEWAKEVRDLMDSEVGSEETWT